MKYSEFERDLEAMGYSISIDLDNLYIRGGERVYLLSVGTHSAYTVNSDYEHFRNLEDSKKERLLDLAWRLAMTPLEERNDEKKYRLRLPFVKKGLTHLAMHKASGNLIISNPVTYYKNFRNEFTKSEIDELEEKHNLDSFVVEEAALKDDGQKMVSG